MRDLPSGQVTFLFTDIEGSTALVQRVGTADYQRLLTDHSALLRGAVEAEAGHEFGSEGDAHFFAFADARAALRAAVGAQQALAAQRWPAERDPLDARSIPAVRLAASARGRSRHRLDPFDSP